MPGLFLQSLSKNFIELGYGTIKSVTKLEQAFVDFQNQFKDPCSANTLKLQRQLNKITQQLKTLSKLLNNILKLVRKILNFTKFLKKLIIALTILTKVLKFFPLPARWVTVGIVVKMGDILAKISFQLKSALLIVLGIDLIVKYISNFLQDVLKRVNDLLNKLKLVTDQLAACSDPEKNKLSTELGSSTGALSVIISELEGQLGDLLTTNNSYKGFTFDIIEEKTVDKQVANRRYAIAINSSGILTLQGTPSYATDTQVLIDELKLIIDRDNLIGYAPDQKSLETINTSTLSSELEQEVLEEFDLDDPDDILADSIESEKDLSELVNTEDTEKSLKEKYNKKQKRFVRFLERKSNKGSGKAKELLDKINKKKMDVAEAQSEWLIHKSDGLLGISI